MTTSQPTSFLYELAVGETIPSEKRAYFGARLRNRLYHFIISKFLEQESAGKLTKAELARRIGRKPEVITRLLASPGNWKVDTVSDLLLGISGEELDFMSFAPAALPTSSFVGSEWSKVNLQTILTKERTGQSAFSPPPANDKQQMQSAEFWRRLSHLPEQSARR